VGGATTTGSMMAFHVPELRRITEGPVKSDRSFGNNGAFLLDSCEPGWQLVLIAAQDQGWEHVSVHATTRTGRNRTPTWREMSFIKDLCWDDDDVVVQYHPRKAEYVNLHPHVLHLWRPIDLVMPTPPIEFV
jgi:hypothetical protein